MDSHVRHDTGKSAGESRLTEQDYANLEARWISREFATRAQLQRADSATGAEIVGRKGGDYSGILIPYFHPGSDQVRDYRLRRDHPDLEYDSAGNLKERRNTSARRGDPTCSTSRPESPTTPSRSGAAGRDHGGRVQDPWPSGALPTMVANRPRFLPLGVSGVYNWRGTIGKTVGPDG